MALFESSPYSSLPRHQYGTNNQTMHDVTELDYVSVFWSN